jgi:phosphoglycolate phosphatase-like HAD superfamily hydrolase
VTHDIVLFDLDGTLTDPGVGIFNSVRHAMSVLGLDPMTDAQVPSRPGP